MVDGVRLVGDDVVDLLFVVVGFVVFDGVWVGDVYILLL